uniref:Uncharacterized protein n=1 Tax=Sphaeramia orbicularis TaxID=375764 RepID=A0A672Y256_9TELE
ELPLRISTVYSPSAFQRGAVCNTASGGVFHRPHEKDKQEESLWISENVPQVYIEKVKDETPHKRRSEGK